MEDDFIFTQEQEIICEFIQSFSKSNYAATYDVLMLSGNIIKDESIVDFPILTRIWDAQTLSGYSVSKKFAPTLLSCFKESIDLLEKGHSVGTSCIDQHMKKLQPLSQWYCFHPKIGKQMCSYSDIENTIVDYNC